MTTITLELPDDLIAKLQARADSQQVTLQAYVQATLVEMVIDDDEPTKESILNAIREGILSVMKGDFGRPIDELLAELEQEEAKEYADSR